MFKALKDNKIIAINDTGKFPCLVYDLIEEDTEHSCDDYRHYDGEFTLIDIDKENAIVKQNREQAYIAEVDPLMSEYNRKKTFNLFDEGEETEFLQAIQNKVAEIKERYPYATVEG